MKVNEKGTYIQLFFMRVCKYLNLRVTTIGEQNGKSRVFQKQKREKTYGDTEIRNSIRDLVFIPFTGCRKVLGKMSAILSIELPHEH